MKKLRLLVTPECNRNCEGCCNKEWNLEALPACTSYEGYDEIILTGGEPMLYPRRVQNIIHQIKSENPTAKIILYSAHQEKLLQHSLMLEHIDGITLTLHTRDDAMKFAMMNEMLLSIEFGHMNLRLNVFKECDYEPHLIMWNVKNNIEWIKDCPLPQDEVFMRWVENGKYD